MFTRRDFLRTSSLLALAPAVPGFLARTARAAATRFHSPVSMRSSASLSRTASTSPIVCVSDSFAVSIQ